MLIIAKPEEDVYGNVVTCDLTKAKYSQRVSETTLTNCTSCQRSRIARGGDMADTYESYEEPC